MILYWKKVQPIRKWKEMQNTKVAVLTLFLNRALYYWGTRWRSWLRPSATSRKVAGLIPDNLNGIFHWHNPSGRIVVQGSTQPLAEMSTRNISRCERRPVRTADNLTTLMCWLPKDLGASTSWNPLGLLRPVMGLLYCTFALYTEYWL